MNTRETGQTDTNPCFFHLSNTGKRVVCCLVFALFFSAVSADAQGLFRKKNRDSPSQPDSGRPGGLFAKIRRSGPGFELPVEEPEKEEKVSRPSYASYSGPLSRPEKKDAEQIRIFVLSDSQGQTEFGPELRSQLLHKHYEVVFISIKNGTPYFWTGMWNSPVLTRVYTPSSEPDQRYAYRNYSMRPRSISEYIEAYDPDVFIFQGGTNFENDLAASNNEYITGLITQSVDAARKKKAVVLWIGSPDSRDNVKSPALQEKAAQAVRDTLAPVAEAQGYDNFFDSRIVCPMPNSAGGDGEHPFPPAAKSWAKDAADWIHQSILNMECDSVLRPAFPEEDTQSQEDLLTENTETAAPEEPEPLASPEPSRAFNMDLNLVAKSKINDVRTLDYTDAFSVFQYELRNPNDVLSQLGEIELTTSQRTTQEGGEFPVVYVLHWTVHNNGKGPALTQVGLREEGQEFQMRLTPLDEHPLKDTLATMYRFDDFNDFLAPIFVATDIMEERSF